MTPQSADRLSEIERLAHNLELGARRTLADVGGGEWAARAFGRGLSFEELRAYSPGDDVRDIAWGATARRGEAFVKVYREDRNRAVWLFAEDATRLDFGFGACPPSPPGRGTLRGPPLLARTQPPRGHPLQEGKETTAELDRVFYAKRRAWLEACALAIFLGETRQDRFGMTLVGRRSLWRPLTRGRRAAQLRIMELLDRHPEPTPMLPLEAVRRLGAVGRRRALAIAVSDFLDDAFTDAVVALARRHETVAARIVDPWERELPNLGLVRWHDATTGMQTVVDTSDRRVRQAFAAAAAEREHRLARRLASAGVRLFTAQTDRPLAAAFDR